jgi:hypothetical protein
MAQIDRVVTAARGVAIVQTVGACWRVHLSGDGGGPVGPTHRSYAAAFACARDFGMVPPDPPAAQSAEVLAAIAGERARIVADLHALAAGWSGPGGEALSRAAARISRGALA